MTHEEWRPVAGHEGRYEVSSFGRVRSLDQIIWIDGGRWGNGYWKRLKGKFRKLCNQKEGNYINVGICGKTYMVHQLVANAFLGPCPEGCHVLHGVGGQHDNSVANLRYGTQTENMFDKYRDGTALVGKRNHQTKLTSKEVLEIRRRDSLGESKTSIACRFNVTEGAIYSILKGKTWKHVSDDKFGVPEIFCANNAQTADQLQLTI